MEQTPFSAKPVLHGTLVTLRPVQESDAEAIATIIRTDHEVARLTGTVHSSTEELLAGMSIEQLRAISASWAVADDRLVLAVIDNTTDTLVGEVVPNDPPHSDASSSNQCTALARIAPCQTGVENCQPLLFE